VINRRLSVVALVATGVLGLATAAGASIAAVGQYGPPPPAPGPALPGFSTVLLSETVGPAGATLPTVTADGATWTLVIPPGAFPADVQITLTAGDLATLGPAAFTGYTITAALGVQVQEMNGTPYPGTFLLPLTLTSHDPAYTAASVVGIWNGTSLTPYTNTTSAPGVVTISFDTDPDFAIMTPTGHAEHAVPAATKPVTGKPVMGAGILAAVLVAVGIGGLTVRRRRDRSRP
jgi:hypothetical protein